MGGIASRNNAGSEETETVSSANIYRFPPKFGNYFGSYFIMGGERFDMSQPESYLFGDNADLNFLGNKPLPFPYSAPNPSEPTKTLKSLVNIRKDSLRFVRVEDGSEERNENETVQMSSNYNIEFVFDSDVRCAITIYYFATEDISNGQLVYHTRDPSMKSETFHYKRGANQLFSQPTHIIDPSKYRDEEWQFDMNTECIPIVIQCTVEDEDNTNHSHVALAVVERSSADGSYMIKALKQKQFVDGLLYLLQEIYGIENKQTDKSKLDPDDDLEDSGAECVICMSDMRDTLILPCRHLCLCSHCAESLRYQASSCPICRSPFRALLQIRAMRKKQAITLHQTDHTEDNPVNQENVPPGYEAVSLIEALNGPCNQLFSNDGSFPVRMQHESDTYHRDKKRSSKRGMNLENGREGQLRADDKKMLEEEERASQELPQVVMMTAEKSPKKQNRDTQRFNKGSQEVASERRSPKAVHLTTPYPGESEVDSDYEMKAIQVKPSHMSAEDLADDEREDTSEGEPEPDYDTDINNLSQQSQDGSVGAVRLSHRVSSEASLEMEEPQEQGAGFPGIKGLSQSSHEISCHRKAYHQLPVGSSTSLPMQSSSSVEGSSFSSTHSSHGLLNSDQVSDEDKRRQTP